MAITDIQISEELETGAPSIKYRGNEGPKSPQEMEMMMMASVDKPFYKPEYADDHAMEMFGKPYEDLNADELEEFMEEMRRLMNKFSGGQPLPEDPTKPVNPFGPKPTGPVLPDKREMAAYGGIMGMDGRRQYGLGSKFKKFVRKIIPNEVAKVAEVAAPFVAPFNPIAAGLMSGIGGFDRTGRIGSSLKSGLMNYGMGQIARGLGGAGMQEGFNLKINPGAEGLRQYFSSPMAAKTAVAQGVSGSDKALFTSDKAMRPDLGLTEVPAGETFISKVANPGKIVQEQSKSIFGELPKLMRDNLSKVGLGNNLVTGLLVGGLGASALMGNMTEEEVQDMSRGDGLDIEGIRTEVIEAMKDPSGDALKAIRIKYPFLGRRDTKDLSAMANGGRIGFANGTKPSGEENTPSQEIINKQIQQIQQMSNMGADIDTIKTITGASDELISMYFGKAMGGRIKRAEGGLMDLGGMEKDYRAEGGFVPIGKAEKADDVPARLSVNEFVFTADAVRNAGGGDIDKGAEVMENVMKHLEAGGQMSEESQGMQGAQRMFEVSERLSEVI